MLKKRDFLLVAALVALLYGSLMARDFTRPFYGLHSWGEAHSAWLVRAHVQYGLAYTKGLLTWAVGDPPPPSPRRYLDHPQLSGLLSAGTMLVFGVNEWAVRLAALLIRLATLPFLIALLRDLYGRSAAILATLFYVLMPVNAYFFMVSPWLFPTVVLAWWCHLRLVGDLPSKSDKRRPLAFGLAFALFFMVQLDWLGFFNAFAIGSHYLLRCISRRRPPEFGLLSVLVLSPLLSLATILGILVAARGGSWGDMLVLYRWRSVIGTEDGRSLESWLGNLYQLSLGAFTAPILFLALGFLAYRSVRWAWGLRRPPRLPAVLGHNERVFTGAWLFLVPGLLFLVVFRELFWIHHYQYQNFALFLAIAAALGTLKIWDLLSRRSMTAQLVPAAVVAVVFGYSMMGLDQYHGVRWRSPIEIELFSRLQRQIPPDEALLSYRSYLIRNNPAKGAHYRPEIAWHLDREIVGATSAAQVEERIATARFPFYLVESSSATNGLVAELRSRYPFEFVQGNPYDPGPPEKVGFRSHYLFDLRARQRAAKSGEAARAECLEYLAQRQFEAAIAACSRSVDLDPASLTARHNLGYAYRLAKRYSEAIEVLEGLLREDPDNSRSSYELASAYAEAGLSDKAREQFRDVLRIDPDHAWAARRLGTLGE